MRQARDRRKDRPRATPRVRRVHILLPQALGISSRAGREPPRAGPPKLMIATRSSRRPGRRALAGAVHCAAGDPPAPRGGTEAKIKPWRFPMTAKRSSRAKASVARAKATRKSTRQAPRKAPRASIRPGGTSYKFPNDPWNTDVFQLDI